MGSLSWKLINILSLSLPLLLCVPGGVVAGESFYRGTEVVELTPATFRSKVLDSNAIWMIEFYAPWCGHCQKLKPDYMKAASSSKGIVRFGAINCDDHKAIGGEYGVKGFPTLKVFGANKKKPMDYTGARSSKSMADFLLAQLPNLVKVVNTKSHPKWVGDNPETPKALLFSAKTVTSSLYKSLALDLKDRMALGEVRAGKEKELMAVYGLEEGEVPVLLVLPPGAEAGVGLERYGGKMKQEALLEFLEKHAIPDKKKKKKAEKEKKEKAEKKEKKEEKKEKAEKKEKKEEKMEKKEKKEKKEEREEGGKKETAKPHKGSLLQLNPGDDVAALCGGGKGLCVLSFVDGEGSVEVPKLESLAKKYANDPLRSLWADSTVFGELKTQFSSASGLVTAVMNNKRQKFVAVAGMDALEQALDRAVGGDLEMKGKLEAGWHDKVKSM